MPKLWKKFKKIFTEKIFKKGHLKTDQIHGESRMYVILLYAVGLSDPFGQRYTDFEHI